MCEGVMEEWRLKLCLLTRIKWGISIRKTLSSIHWRTWLQGNKGTAESVPRKQCHQSTLFSPSLFVSSSQKQQKYHLKKKMPLMVLSSRRYIFTLYRLFVVAYSSATNTPPPLYGCVVRRQFRALMASYCGIIFIVSDWIIRINEGNRSSSSTTPTDTITTPELETVVYIMASKFNWWCDIFKFNCTFLLILYYMLCSHNEMYIVDLVLLICICNSTLSRKCK